MTGVIITREDTQMPREKKTCDYIGRHWIYIYIKPKNIKGCPQSSDARRVAWKKFSLRDSRKKQHSQHLDSRLLSSRTVEE